RVADPREQLALDARFRSQRSGSHRKEPLGIDRPPGVLRCHARFRRVIRPDLETGPRLLLDRHRSEIDVPKAAHADLGEGATCAQAARRADAGVDDARSAWQRVDVDLELARGQLASIRERPRTLVHPEIWRVVHTASSTLGPSIGGTVI